MPGNHRQQKPTVSRISLPHPAKLAKTSHLRYVTDDSPGITRKRRRNGFRYFDTQGRVLRQLEQLRRIKSLVIPPAWEHVWISPWADSHLQATGRDARGRKQHRYHPHWRLVRDQTKFDRMTAFGRVLPGLRRRLNRDLARPGLPRDKVLATVVKLLERTLIRIGNEEYARHNRSFGLTTMRSKHVKVRGSKIRLDGSLLNPLSQKADPEAAKVLSTLNPDESAVMAILQQSKVEAKRKAA